jgi:hypothetical protein
LIYGFRGNVTGVAKSAQSSVAAFVLTISEAKADARFAATNDGSKLIGKSITLGVRMVRAPPGSQNAVPAADDVAFIKPSRRACVSPSSSSP